jgi:arylsulfatase
VAQLQARSDRPDARAGRTREAGDLRLINLAVDPQEREPVALPHLHTWVATHVNRIIAEFEASVHRERPIPMGASLDHVPTPPPG